MNKTVTLNIDSRFRKNYYTSISSDFDIDLHYSLHNITTMKLKNIHLPNSWYEIKEEYKNNYLYIGAVKITIPDGNYTNVSFKSTFEDLCTTAGLSIWFTLDMKNGSSKIYDPVGGGIQITFTEGDDEFCNSLGWMLGYRKNNLTGSSEYYGSAIFNLNKINYVYLVVNDFNYDNELIIGNLKDSYLAGNILSIIRVNARSYDSVNIDTWESQLRVYPSPVDINKINVKILDMNGKILNLNGNDLSFSLEFTLK